MEIGTLIYFITIWVLKHTQSGYLCFCVFTSWQGLNPLYFTCFWNITGSFQFKITIFDIFILQFIFIAIRWIIIDMCNFPSKLIYFNIIKIKWRKCINFTILSKCLNLNILFQICYLFLWFVDVTFFLFNEFLLYRIILYLSYAIIAFALNSHFICFRSFCTLSIYLLIMLKVKHILCSISIYYCHF